MHRWTKEEETPSNLKETAVDVGVLLEIFVFNSLLSVEFIFVQCVFSWWATLRWDGKVIVITYWTTLQTWNYCTTLLNYFFFWKHVCSIPFCCASLISWIIKQYTKAIFLTSKRQKSFLLFQPGSNFLRDSPFFSKITGESADIAVNHLKTAHLRCAVVMELLLRIEVVIIFQSKAVILADFLQKTSFKSRTDIFMCECLKQIFHEIYIVAINWRVNKI